MGYSIRRKRYIPAKGAVEEILGHDGLWYFECEDVFPSLLIAKSWFYEISSGLKDPFGSVNAKYYIQGPNGGIHSLKRRLKYEIV